MNVAFTAKNNCEIDNAFAATLQTFTCDQDIGGKTLMGNGGNMGILKSSGSNITGSLVFGVPLTGLEFDLDAWIASEEGKLVTFSSGANRYILTGTQIMGRSFNSVPGAPDYSVTVKYRATDITTV